MKKNNKKEILFLFLFIVILVVIEVVLPKTKVAKEKEEVPVTLEEENAYGDTVHWSCPEGCLCSAKTNGGSGNWFCGPNAAAYRYVSSNDECYYLHGIKCLNGCHETKRVVGYTCDRCKSGYTMNSAGVCEANEPSTPTPSPTPEKKCEITTFTRYNMGSTLAEPYITIGAEKCPIGATIKLTVSSGISIQSGSPQKVGTNGKGSVTYRIKYLAPCGETVRYTATAGSTTESQKVLISNYWNKKTDYIIGHLPTYATQYGADINAAWEYGFSCIALDNGKYRCAEYGWRSCGEPGDIPDVTAPPINNVGTSTPTPSCWANAKSLYDATKAEWRTGASGDMTHKITKLDDAKSVKITQELCVPMKKATYCIPKEKTPGEQKITTDKCEADLTIKYDDGKDCSGNKFYKLSCKNTINIQYDNGDDKDEDNKTGTVNNITVGGGFEFGINTAIKRECEATFDIDNNWTNAYKKSVKQLDTLEKAIKVASNADQKALESRIYELKNKINEIKQVAKDYNDEMEKINFEATATALVKYKDSSGKDKSSSATFASTVLDAGSINLKKVKELKLIKDELTVYNYKWNNNSNPKIVKLNFPKTYINPITGKIADDGTGIDGGNKLYFEYDANSSKNGDQSTIELVFKRTVNKKDLVIITNTCCKVAEYSSQVKYRPISLTNPFINKDYKKGANWVNSMYDFTKTIKSNVWDGKPVYDIELTAQQVSDLKYSNVRNQSDSPYLGLCDRVKTSMLDDTEKKICSLLK